MHRKTFVVLFLALLVAAFGAAPAHVQAAARPRNDDLAKATVITALPFSDTVDMTNATSQAGEPQPAQCFLNGPLANYPRTVWYSITSQAGMAVDLDLSGSSSRGGRFETAIYQQTGSGFAGLQLVGCEVPDWTEASVHLDGGKTYLFQVHDFTNVAGDTLVFKVSPLAAPANDNFAAATSLAVPFSETTPLAGAARETGEPVASCGRYDQTAWYSYTATTNDRIFLSVFSFRYGAAPNTIAVYAGQGLSGLSEIGCDVDPYYAGLHYLELAPQAGTTYYFQVAAAAVEWGMLRVTVNYVDALAPGFAYTPSDPSLYDAVQFTDTSWDPFGLGISAEAWTFGDGSTATGPSPTHTYKKDGDYTVTLNIAAPDGRTATTAQTVSIRTHDIKVEALSVPQSAASGQTRKITAAIDNERYPEQVSVDFYRSNAYGGYDYVGTQAQAVPVQDGPTNISLAYTFTPADAALGQVYFQAFATILGHRDARPNDNQAAAGPVSMLK